MTMSLEWTYRIVFHCSLFVIVRSEEVFNTTPPPVKTNFSCYGRPAGFYADVDANCKVYHTCDDYGNTFSYRCPEETAFRQDALICDHAHLVDCQNIIGTTVSSKLQNEDVEKRENAAPEMRAVSVNSPRSYSRSFQVIQQPSESTRKQPGFVFSSSVFLRSFNGPESVATNSRKKSQEITRNEHSTILVKTTDRNEDFCDAHREKENVGDDVISATSTLRPMPSRSDFTTSIFNRFPNVRAQAPFTMRLSENRYLREKHEQHSDRNEDLAGSDYVAKGAAKSGEKESRSDFRTTATILSSTRNFLQSSNSNNRDYPYLETLRSIQANGKSSRNTTVPKSWNTESTEIPVHALTLSLKPLVPNELEYDPYYPNLPTSTEPYYTPANEKRFQTSTRTPWTQWAHGTYGTRHAIAFEIPAVLPDLNTLEDLLDRRKLFYIPRIKSHS